MKIISEAVPTRYYLVYWGEIRRSRDKSFKKTDVAIQDSLDNHLYYRNH